MSTGRRENSGGVIQVFTGISEMNVDADHEFLNSAGLTAATCIFNSVSQ